MATIVVENDGVLTILIQDLSLENVSVTTCGEELSTILTSLYWGSCDKEIEELEDDIE
jgi:hypothetical protein